MDNKAFLITAFIGMLLSVYAIPLHFANDGSSLCDIGETLSCDKVNKSQWSTFVGVPVAFLGLIAYAVVFLLVLKQKSIRQKLEFTRKDFAQYLLVITVIMFAFQAYLTITEIFFIHAYCIVCLGSQACTIALVWLAWKEYNKSN